VVTLSKSVNGKFAHGKADAFSGKLSLFTQQRVGWCVPLEGADHPESLAG